MESKKLLITGVAGFIGSNLADYFVKQGYYVVGLDNFSTGKWENIAHLSHHPNFSFVEGDIRNFETCNTAVKGCDYVLHQAALGSVPRSINDPITSNDVNINGFLNMITAARDEKVTRFIFAASSSTYGDSEALPKVEDIIGKPLSPYAITKYVNELYADVFSKTYGIETIGLRYFNVFGRKQDPNGAYAAAIPKFVLQFMRYESPVDLVKTIQKELSVLDPKIADVKIIHGPNRVGDIPHSLASIEKAKNLLNYAPKFDLEAGLKEAIQWYWKNLKQIV